MSLHLTFFMTKRNHSYARDGFLHPPARGGLAASSTTAFRYHHQSYWIPPPATTPLPGCKGFCPCLGCEASIGPLNDGRGTHATRFYTSPSRVGEGIYRTLFFKKNLSCLEGSHRSHTRKRNMNILSHTCRAVSNAEGTSPRGVQSNTGPQRWESQLV